jgi:hypothetical protein
MGRTVNALATAYGGSNPSRGTKLITEARMSKYKLMTHFDGNSGRYVIYEGNISNLKEIWGRPYIENEDCGEYLYPKDVRVKYEELTGKSEFDPNWDGSRFVNLVELVCDEGGHDQPCRWGNRCEDHAVYCTNDGWLYSPRKCRRTWYTGGKTRDEDCPGFAPNPMLTREN